MRACFGMLVVETIAKIRRAYFVQKKPIKAICRELGLSRKVVRKLLRSDATEFHTGVRRSRSRRLAPGASGLIRSCSPTKARRRANG
jgi:hypothetical protein